MTAKKFNSTAMDSPESLFILEKPTFVREDPKNHVVVFRGRIRPLPELNCHCNPPEPYRQACNEYSVFEVTARSKEHLHAVLPEFNPKTISYEFELLLPAAGEYKVTAWIFLWNHQDIKDCFISRKQYLNAFWNSSEEKKKLLRIREKAVLEGETKVEVQDYPVFHPLFPPSLCSPDDFSGYLPGSWGDESTYWKPYSCTLGFRSLNKEEVRKALSGLWIMFLGDSNTRKLFQSLCKISNGHESSNDTDYSCTGKDFVFTERIYWFGHNSIPGLDLVETVRNAKGKVPDNPKLKAKKKPDFVFYSFGSHTPRLTGDIMPSTIVKVIEDEHPDWIEEKKLGILMTTASVGTKIPKRQEFYGMQLLQNNQRIKWVNDAIVTFFQEKAAIFDFFSTTLPLALSKRTVDAVHFNSEVYELHGRMLLTFIQQRKG